MRGPIMARMNATLAVRRKFALAAIFLATPCASATLEEVVVTATRSPIALATYAGSATRIESGTVALVGATHSSELVESRGGHDDPARQRAGVADGAALARC